MTAKISLEEMQKRISEKWNYISIIPETFISSKKVCSFLDLDFGIFTSTPQNLLTGRSLPGHRDRFREQIQETGSRAGRKAAEKRKETNGYSSIEEMKTETKKRKTARKQESRKRKSEERKRFYLENYGVSWKGATPEARKARSERAKRQDLTLFRKAQKEKVVPAIRYFVNDRPYYEYSDAVGWNRDAARYFISKNGPEAFLNSCKEYDSTNAMNLLEKFCISEFKVERFNRNVLKYRPDFTVRDGVFLNCDGLYWHSDQNLPNNYHFNLRLKLEQQNIRIIQFREDEIYKKTKICNSIITSIRGENKKVYARNLKIKQMNSDFTEKFLSENHLMSPLKRKSYVLEKDGIAYSMIVVSMKGRVMKIDRFCSLINHSVVGGFSKLLKFVENLHKPETIQSWVDLRYGDGHSLEKIGFSKVKEVLSWKWANRHTTYNRLHCRANMDDRKLSEKEHAKELGLFKIYDAGQRLYEKRVE